MHKSNNTAGHTSLPLVTKLLMMARISLTLYELTVCMGEWGNMTHCLVKTSLDIGVLLSAVMFFLLTLNVSFLRGI